MTERQSTDIPQLTAEQWAGLATLGQAVNGLTGPLAAPATAWLNQAMAAEQRDDISGLLQELVATGVALRDSGLLSLLREQAPLIAELVRAVGPLSTELRKLPVNELADTLSELRGWLKRLRELDAFAAEHLAGPATKWTTDVTAFAVENDLDGTARDLVQTLALWHRNGTFERLRELSELLEPNGDEAALAGAVGEGASRLRNGLGRLLVALAQADRAADDEHDGGVTGLIRLLRDPDVQHGLRLLALLPGQLRHAA